MQPLMLDATADAVVLFLKKRLQYQPIHQDIVRQQVILQVAEERGVSVSDAEIQVVAEQQRSERRLERAADAIAWLAEQRLTPQEWEAGIREQILANKLAEHLFGADVEKRFMENRRQYDRVNLYQLVVADEPLAQELFYQIDSGELSFFEAAHRYDISDDRRLKCGFEGALYRWQVPTPIAVQVFQSHPGDLIGPLSMGATYHIFWVKEVRSSELTPAIHAEILQAVYQDWLTAEVTYRMYHQLDTITPVVSQ
jgi:hypothetical protein